MNKSFLFFISFVVCLACTIFLTTCAKEYSYEGGNTNGHSTGTGVYSLMGAGSACSGAVTEGNFYAGVELTAGNTVTLQVSVVSAGTYFLTTNSANNIQFSASGSFTDTGVHSIVLTGNGTPASEGNFTFTPPVGLGCSFAIEVTKQPEVVARFTLAGAPNDCTSPVINGKYVYGVPMALSNSVIVTVQVTDIGNYTLQTDTINGISFSSSGVFTDTGIQNITLKGSGIPPVPGNLLFTVSGASTNCHFIVTVMPPQPLAVYVLESNYDGVCSAVSVKGIYTSGSSLTSSHTVTFKIFATEAGNLSIETNTVNGMTFSYYGTLATPDGQFIILSGKGTPVSAGTFTFTPLIVGPHPLGGEACNFNVEVN